MISDGDYFQHLHDLINEYTLDYVILALKQINDQQLLHLSFDDLPFLDDPILKLYIQVVEELEAVLFHPETGYLTIEEQTRIVGESVDLIRRLRMDKCSE